MEIKENTPYVSENYLKILYYNNQTNFLQQKLVGSDE